MTRKEKRLLKKYLILITMNLILWIGIVIIAMIKIGIYEL